MQAISNAVERNYMRYAIKNEITQKSLAPLRARLFCETACVFI